jgi:hypothetical protein
MSGNLRESQKISERFQKVPEVLKEISKILRETVEAN